MQYEKRFESSLQQHAWDVATLEDCYFWSQQCNRHIHKSCTKREIWIWINTSWNALLQFHHFVLSTINQYLIQFSQASNLFVRSSSLLFLYRLVDYLCDGGWRGNSRLNLEMYREDFEGRKWEKFEIWYAKRSKEFFLVDLDQNTIQKKFLQVTSFKAFLVTKLFPVFKFPKKVLPFQALPVVVFCKICVLTSNNIVEPNVKTFSSLHHHRSSYIDYFPRPSSYSYCSHAIIMKFSCRTSSSFISHVKFNIHAE